MTEITDQMIETVAEVLSSEGADTEHGWHGWRCFDKDRYPEPCSCRTHHRGGDDMSEYPSDLGHWGRINESANAIDYSRELNMHTVVEDVCRALLDLNEAIRTAKADAWDEGFDTGATHGIAYQAGSNDSLPRHPGLNPYREETT